MNCPICKKELEIKNKKVGETAAGEAIYNEFAICHDCKKQWNLDKQRAKSNATEKETKTEEPPKPAPVPKKKRPVSSDAPEQPVRKVKKKRPVNPDAAKATTSAKQKETSEADAPTRVIPTEELDAKLEAMKLQEERPRKKKRPAPSDAPEQPVRKEKKRPAPSDVQSDKIASEMSVQERPRKKKRRPVESQGNDLPIRLETEEEVPEKKYSNIPPKHVREAREKEMRENYQNMLDEEEEEGGSPIILILVIIILLLAVAAFAGYWFLLR